MINLRLLHSLYHLKAFQIGSPFIFPYRQFDRLVLFRQQMDIHAEPVLLYCNRLTEFLTA